MKSNFENLKNKIEAKQIKAGIIGLGYVGLPLAVEFASEGIETYGIDIDQRKTDSISKGKSYIQDVDQNKFSELVKAKKLRATTDFKIIQKLDTINICVPTPLGKSKDPDMSYIVAAAEKISQYLHPGLLVILESTTYPGTTEEVILPMLEKKGMKVGKDFFLAFSPERVDPGNPHFRTRNIPKVIGGVTPHCAQLAKLFYEHAIDKVHLVSSPRAAEMVKLLENTFRSVNIGLVNEMCLMSEKLKVNIWEVIEGAATKPFGFMPFFPGPGLGGHCIPIDPHYLAWKARVHGFNPRFIELASEINGSMPSFVVHRAQQVLNDQKKALRGARVVIGGVAYKKNVDDMRESPALEIIEMLEDAGAKVSYMDPHIPQLTVGHKKYTSIDHRKINSGKYDLLVIVADHDAFNYPALISKFPKVLDTRNALKLFTSPKIAKI